MSGGSRGSVGSFTTCGVLLRFFKWGGIYSRFHPEAGGEVAKKWGVKLTGPNAKAKPTEAQ